MRTETQLRTHYDRSSQSDCGRGIALNREQRIRMARYNNRIVYKRQGKVTSYTYIYGEPGVAGATDPIASSEDVCI